MSQYQISKKRLAQIIKEEYQSLQEAPYLDMPPEERPFSDDEGVESAKLEIRGTMRPTLERARKLAQVSGLGFDSEHMRQALHELVDSVFAPQTEAKEKGKYDDGDGKDEKCDYVDCEDEGDKKVKEESLDSIRQLIQQELQNL